MSRQSHTAVITGASRGIGAETARRLYSAGWSVAVNYYRSQDEAYKLVAELGERAMAVRADVSDNSQVEDMFSAVEHRFGGVDVLVNNAGISFFGLLTDTSPEEWRRVFAVNADGVYNCCRRAIPHMVREKRGSIVNVSSIWGIAGASCEAAYSASKAAVIGLTKALAKELGPSGIRVNCIAPGVTATDMNTRLSGDDLDSLCAQTPLGVIGSPGDIAEAVCFLASDRARFITGQALTVDGGFIL